MARASTRRMERARPELVSPVSTFDLAEEVDALHVDEGWRTHGHSAKSLAKHRGLTIVLIALKRETRIKEHHVEGAVSIHVLSGRIAIHVDSRTLDAPAGSLVVLDRGLPHDVVASEESTFLLSVCALRNQ